MKETSKNFWGEQKAHSAKQQQNRDKSVRYIVTLPFKCREKIGNYQNIAMVQFLRIEKTSRTKPNIECSHVVMPCVQWRFFKYVYNADITKMYGNNGKKTHPFILLEKTHVAPIYNCHCQDWNFGVRFSSQILLLLFFYRVAEITDIVGFQNWKHIESHDNPADIASRGCFADESKTLNFHKSHRPIHTKITEDPLHHFSSLLEK